MEVGHIAQSMLFMSFFMSIYAHSACGPACVPRGPSGVAIAAIVEAMGLQLLSNSPRQCLQTRHNYSVRNCIDFGQHDSKSACFNFLKSPTDACATLATAAVLSSLQSASGPGAAPGGECTGAWGSRDMVPNLVTGTIENVHFYKVL